MKHHLPPVYEAWRTCKFWRNSLPWLGEEEEDRQRQRSVTQKDSFVIRNLAQKFLTWLWQLQAEYSMQRRDWVLFAMYSAIWITSDCHILFEKQSWHLARCPGDWLLTFSQMQILLPQQTFTVNVPFAVMRLQSLSKTSPRSDKQSP